MAVDVSLLDSGFSGFGFSFTMGYGGPVTK
jgi:hypothetical protein